MAKTFIEFNYCVESFSNVNNKCKLVFPSGEVVGLPKRCQKYIKINDCTDSSQLQMTVNDYNLMMGVRSNMLGFTLVFLVGFLFILQGRR